MIHPSNAELRALDLAHVWHPCTQMKDHEATMPLVPLRRGQGVWLEDYDGHRYLDAISSWWVNLWGHANPHINAAVSAQLERLPHAMFAGFTHEPGAQLAAELVAVAPPGLNRCFFADSGSASIEVAVKMSFHFWQNTGRPGKTRFVTLSNSYHGETLGALAVGSVELYKAIYKPLLMDVITVPSPDAFTAEPGESSTDVARRRAAELEQVLATQADEVAAVLLEPLVQCAGNMRMHDPLYLKLVREACDRYGVHLIADEIAVGFGRTGTLFACEQAEITPDFLCLSKGLTAGYLPMSVVLTRESIYAAFYDEYVKLNAFLHSHSYSGNPLACAAALASLRLFRERDALNANRALADYLGAKTRRAFDDHPNVAEVRQRGLIVAVEFVRDRNTRRNFDWRERRHLHVYRHALSRGVLLRPLGNVIYFMPPYVISREEIDLMVEVAREGLDLAVRAEAAV
ncbi:MAG: adenosylmethionine--8-amino-7-oxononanoate transaminase [Gammaproteobacteria bacterium]|jgi:adenosylmethionine-8-amino-7-oxononanoate aminotransferase|nr:adenosylmethionine--8-amino-7-oxononanoate transaminase [Gammaproteobacteria bacterium]